MIIYACILAYCIYARGSSVAFHNRKLNSINVYFIIFNSKMLKSHAVVFVDHCSLLNPVLVHFDYTFYIMFQVYPRKHRLLLEVFDENRLVSSLVMFNFSVYNVYSTQTLDTFFIWIGLFVFLYKIFESASWCSVNFGGEVWKAWFTLGLQLTIIFLIN